MCGALSVISGGDDRRRDQPRAAGRAPRGWQERAEADRQVRRVAVLGGRRRAQQRAAGDLNGTEALRREVKLFAEFDVVGTTHLPRPCLKGPAHEEYREGRTQLVLLILGREGVVDRSMSCRLAEGKGERRDGAY